MIESVEIRVSLHKIKDEAYLQSQIKRNIKSRFNEVKHFILTRRSIDARGHQPLFILRYDVYVNEEYHPPQTIKSRYQDVTEAKKVVIVGAGPAGYFAALKMLELGLKPIVLDRGQDVQSRRRDLRAIQQEGVVNPHSNYCFGEGGAGTYSDGKLYTRSQKRGKIIDVIQTLHEHGAPDDILIDAHPHIGSNKLPKIISDIRETIISFGGEVHFDAYVIDLIISDKVIRGVATEDGRTFLGESTIVATGHSARDIYKLFQKKGITIEAKPFALGVRIEHPQSIIDLLQYNQENRPEELPASSYKVVAQVDELGVFSFCMCPGGLVVPAATAPGEIVVNGMSLSRRDSPFANSGFVTSIELDELERHGYSGVFAAMDFQAHVEKQMFDAGDGSQKAPAQRMTDFVNEKVSEQLNATSYIPGIYSAPLHALLPSFVYQRLKAGILQIEKKMKGYLTDKANVIGVESRTSAPIRIPRNKETYQHEEITGLFPCGEGAGYAGGILSAAMDGQNVAIAVNAFLKKREE